MKIAFPLSETTQARLTTLLDQVDAADNKKVLAAELVQLIDQMAEEGLGYFFTESLRQAKVNSLMVAATERAISGGKKAVMFVGRQVIMGMSNEQLDILSKRMREMMA